METNTFGESLKTNSQGHSMKQQQQQEEDEDTTAEETVTTTLTASSTSFLIPRPLRADPRASDMVSTASAAPFRRPPPSTNLHHSPPNWLRSSMPGGGDLAPGQLDPSAGGLGRFSSFQMASDFPEFVSRRVADVMADAENIKSLLKMPYSPDAPVSLVVHRVGRTLLVDNFDIHGFLLRSSEEEWAWLRRFFLTRVFGGGLGERKDRAVVRRSNKSDDIRQRNLVSKFLYRSLEAPAKLCK